jgi:hypothetical protein
VGVGGHVLVCVRACVCKKGTCVLQCPVLIGGCFAPLPDLVLAALLGCCLVWVSSVQQLQRCTAPVCKPPSAEKAAQELPNT